MTTTTMQRMSLRLSFIRTAIVINAAVLIWAGAALIVVPDWFYANIGYYPPFNHHYMGDGGAFQLALGIGLLLTVRHPFRYRLLIAVGAGASLLHAINHIYDDVLLHQFALSQWLVNTWSLLFMAILLIVAVVMSRAEGERA